MVERLRRLRDRFGGDILEHQVDHDHDHVTSTRREHVPVRKFFVGEIWWADRYALGDRRPYREDSSHLPALVTRREDLPHEPIEMAPSAQRASDTADERCFRATEPPEGLLVETVFLLPHRRPVARYCLGAPMGVLRGEDKQLLVQAMEALRL